MSMRSVINNVAMIVLCILLGFMSSACTRKPESKAKLKAEQEGWINMRKQMVEQLRIYKIRDPRVLEAMGKVRRHIYIPQEFRNDKIAYGNHPSPIGYEQTISQPYIVAYMTEKMSLKKGEKVLEVGTGSGYQAAILAEMGVDVYGIEIIPELAEHARRVLQAEGYEKVKVRTGDGYKGWPEQAPFDAILVACAPTQLPKALVEQLKEGGRMIIPVGEIFAQRLVILNKKGGAIVQEDDLPVRFVPMIHGSNGNL